MLQAAQLVPYFNVTALGGQYFTGDTHSTGINADYNLVPAVQVNPNFLVIPIYFGSYHQTQIVYNFLGQNTLVTKQLDSQETLRLDWTFAPSWHLKPRAGYKQEWSKESTDENLWNSLLKYNRVFGGASVERQLGRGSIEFGFEYGITKYPNYQSLNANPLLTTTGITAVLGTDVLNYRSVETSVIYKRPLFHRWFLDTTFSWIGEEFPDQKVLIQASDGAESVVDSLRKDNILNWSANETFHQNDHWSYAMNETLQFYLSNQNSFDATQNQASPFTFHYYNFVDLQWTPSVTWTSGRYSITPSVNLGYRQYTNRRTQDGNGDYLNGTTVHSFNRGVSLTCKYRLMKQLSLVLTANALTYTSNTHYEVNYPYNYSVYTYLGGLNWKFY